jgi:hypothetical protein
MSEIKLVYDIEEHSDPEAFVQLLSSMSLLILSLVNESLQRWFRPLLERPVTLPRCEYNYKTIDAGWEKICTLPGHFHRMKMI